MSFLLNLGASHIDVRVSVGLVAVIVVCISAGAAHSGKLSALVSASVGMFGSLCGGGVRSLSAARLSVFRVV